MIPHRAWLPWALLGAVALVSAVGAPAGTVAARLFFVATLGGALVVGLGVAGSKWQTTAAGTLLVLAVIQTVGDRPISDPPSSQWTVSLHAPAHRLRHAIALPLESREWERWWRRAAGASVYLCARGPLNDEDGLDLHLAGQRVARVTQALAYGPRPQPTSVGFYRIPITRAQLERAAPIATFELTRAEGATSRPIEICGTFTYRPSAGIESSTFFDGRTWSSPGTTQRGRYVIEVRLEEPSGKQIAALY